MELSSYRSAVILTCLLLCCAAASYCKDEGPRKQREEPGPEAAFSQILGRPTDNSVTLSVLSAAGGGEVYAEWGAGPGSLDAKSAPAGLKPGVPAEIEINGLRPDTLYYYKLVVKSPSRTSFTPEEASQFRTRRSAGSAFTFEVQGDSHPERRGKMFSPDLYSRVLRRAAADKPDFYIAMGDDFSIERLIERKELTQDAVDQVYAYQRGFLGLVGRIAPLFLVNGNHEQAARYLLDGTENSAAVLAARARNKFYPLPVPGGFYSGDLEKVPQIGLLRDYYAWTWGDALFVVIDPYWHSPEAVDNKAGERAGKGEKNGGGGKGGKKRGGKGGQIGGRASGDGDAGGGGGKGRRDPWQATLGEEQYRWLEKTLTGSKARWKFVFAHHVNGTGRGGVEAAGLYEWGGTDRNGEDRFKEKRPGWALPVQALMAKAGVTVFFQGHDHIYARQELDGVVYQSLPNPADDTFTSFNQEAYRSGTVLPNSGYLRVSVSPAAVKVDYVRFSDELDGEVAASYSVGGGEAK